MCLTNNDSIWRAREAATAYNGELEAGEMLCRNLRRPALRS